MIDECLICEKIVKDYDPKMCCSGQECGCMGMPTNPCVCSNECFDACMKYDGNTFEEIRIQAGIKKVIRQ